MRSTIRILALAAFPAVYANTFTNLLGDIYQAVDVVSRELVGFLPGITLSASANRAALNQAVTFAVSPAAVARDIVPAMQVPEPTDHVFGNDTITITKSRAVPFGITGEEAMAVNNGVGFLTVQGGFIAQALRTLANEMEADIAVEAYKHASRAYGTAGATPFATSVADSAQLRKILDDNGAPLTERSLVGSTATGASIRSLSNFSKANEAGTTLTLRDGQLLDVHGFSLRESGGIPLHTKGTGASSTTNAAGYAIGATVITLAATGTGTIVAGDVITFAGDTNKYVVVSGDADVSNGGTITIGKPGLRQAIAASATAITVGGNYTPNVGYSRDALLLAARAPAIPPGGDIAAERIQVTDVRSGITFDFAHYLGYYKNEWEVALAWGVKAAKQAHIAVLLG